MASPVGSAPRSPSSSPRAESSTAAAVTAAAKPALTAVASSSTGAPLRTVPTRFDFNNYYLQKADQRFKANNLEDANGFYRVALQTFNEFKKDPDEDFIELSNIPAACYIGLAKTCDPSEKESTIELAREALDDAYKNRSKWDGLDPEKKSRAYIQFKKNLENSYSLLKESRSPVTDEMFEECENHILPLYAATYGLREGQELFKLNDIEGARNAYSDAFGFSENLEIVEEHAIKASCMIGLAALYQPEKTERPDSAGLAYREIVCLYAAIKRQPSENDYKRTLHLCDELRKLIPDTFKFLPSLLLIIDDCQKELELLKNPAPENQASPGGSGSATRQPQSYFGIFAAFVLGGLTALAGAWLYGRFITKIE